MKHFLLIASCIFYLFNNSGFAQDYDDLLTLYLDEKYEKLKDKASSYIQSDSHNDNPPPYIYCSMAFYELSKGAYSKDDSQKQALNYAVMFVNKDKESEYVTEFLDYFTELRVALVATIEAMLEKKQDIKQWYEIYKGLIVIDADDSGAWLMRAYCESDMGMAADAETALKKATTLIASIDTLDDLYEEQVRLLKLGLITYATHLVEQGNKDAAKELMELGDRLFEYDTAYQKKFDEIK